METGMNEHLLNPLSSDDYVDELGERGSAIYENRLKALLEPARNNQFVAIHVDSGDYEVARTSGSAMRAIRKKHPREGRLFIRKIGTEPEYQLASRICGSATERRASTPRTSRTS